MTSAGASLEKTELLHSFLLLRKQFLELVDFLSGELGVLDDVKQHGGWPAAKGPFGE